MNIKAIVASLVLGSSLLAVQGAAMAAPCEPAPAAPVRPIYQQPVYQQPVYQQPVYRQPIEAQPVYRQPINIQPISYPPPAPVTYARPPLFQPVTLANGLTFQGSGRQFISVGAQAGRFGKLDIRSSGPTFISQVYIQFANGQEQVVRNLNRTLSGNDCLTLDLDGGRRAIQRIVVYGNDLGRRRIAGSFSVTAA